MLKNYLAFGGKLNEALLFIYLKELIRKIMI